MKLKMLVFFILTSTICAGANAEAEKEQCKTQFVDVENCAIHRIQGHSDFNDPECWCDYQKGGYAPSSQVHGEQDKVCKNNNNNKVVGFQSIKIKVDWRERDIIARISPVGEYYWATKDGSGRMMMKEWDDTVEQCPIILPDD